MPPVLLLVDVQNNMLLPPEPVPAAGAVRPVLDDLLERARAAGAPVVFVRNSGGAGDPDEPHTPGWELVHPVRPGEHVVDKTTADSFAGTPLSGLLAPGAPLVVAGMQSEYCVRSTTLRALREGHPVTLVRGGHATYDGDEPAATTSHRVELELAAAGAHVADPADVRFA